MEQPPYLTEGYKSINIKPIIYNFIPPAKQIFIFYNVCAHKMQNFIAPTEGGISFLFPIGFIGNSNTQLAIAATKFIVKWNIR